jgi:hypothetical protein
MPDTPRLWGRLESPEAGRNAIDGAWADYSSGSPQDYHAVWDFLCEHLAEHGATGPCPEPEPFGEISSSPEHTARRVVTRMLEDDLPKAAGRTANGWVFLWRTKTGK